MSKSELKRLAIQRGEQYWDAESAAKEMDRLVLERDALRADLAKAKLGWDSAYSQAMTNGQRAFKAEAELAEAERMRDFNEQLADELQAELAAIKAQSNVCHMNSVPCNDDDCPICSKYFVTKAGRFSDVAIDTNIIKE